MSEIELVTEVLMSISALVLIAWSLWQYRQLMSESRAGQADKEGAREFDILVGNGFQPSSITVKAGQTVRLNFMRDEKSSCGEEVLIPEFGQSLRLLVNQRVTVEVTPERPGEYEFTCSRKVCRGKLIVR